MQNYDKTYLERLQAATNGIDLTAGEERTLKWLSGWDAPTVDNVSHIIEKARGARTGELTQQDLFEGEIRDAASIEDATIRDSVTTNNTKWAAEIRDLQQKINREAGEV